MKGMSKLHGRLAIGWLLGLILLAGSGCDDDPGLFATCPLSQSILNVCAEDSDSTSVTCIVERHPMCEEQICASWAGSDSFCSRACDVDADCPIASKCLLHRELGVCVPDDIESSIAR